MSGGSVAGELVCVQSGGAVEQDGGFQVRVTSDLARQAAVPATVHLVLVVEVHRIRPGTTELLHILVPLVVSGVLHLSVLGGLPRLVGVGAAHFRSPFE